MLQVVCGQCETGNRVAAGRDPTEGKCGRCGAPLFSGKPVEVTGEGLERRRRLTQGAALLVDVWAPWCGPCRMMAPAYAAAAPRLAPEVQLLKLNSETEQQAASKLRIHSIPTMILFRGETEVARSMGAMTADQIVQWTRRALGEAAAA
jgi:thioredoxin 2